MWTLALLVVAAPAWGVELDIDPTPSELALEGTGIPSEAAHLRPLEALTIHTDGPGKITLRFIGLRQRSNGRLSKPGMAVVWVDGKLHKKVQLRNKRQSGWRVSGKKRWIPTRERQISIPLKPGTHTVIVRVRKNARIGLGLIVEVDNPSAPPAVNVSATEPGGTESTQSDLAHSASTKSASSSSESGTEPKTPLMAADTPPQLPEPSRAIASSPIRIVSEPGIAVSGAPSTHTIHGPSGDEKFYLATIDEGLSLDAMGPGLLSLDIHAHRQSDTPDTLKTLIVGVMLDEVLLKSLAIGEAAGSAYTIDGAVFSLSARTTQRVPINAGSHKIRLTLSDTASAGASVRPQFAGTGRFDEPGLLSAEVARSDDLHIEAPPPEVSGDVSVAMLGAGFLPLELSHLGFAVRAETAFAVPVAGPHFSIGLGVSMARVHDPRTYADPRAANGIARMSSTLTSMPVLAEAKWSAAMPSPLGLEIGIGGGALLGWMELRAGGVTISDNSVTAAAVAQLTWTLHMGPGQVLLRSDFILAHPFAARQIGLVDPSGASFGLGYRWIFGGE